MIAIFFGVFVEGETVAITGGVMAHRHLLVLWQVVVTAGVAAALSDNLYFFLGRRYRDHARVKSFMARKSFARALSIIDKGPARFASVFRFIPGMRIVGPLALAQTRIETSRFVILSCLSAAIWAIVFTVLGHFVGRLVSAVFGREHRVEHLLIAAAVVLVVVGGLRLRANLRRQRDAQSHS